MARCNCGSQTCSCVIRQGDGVTITGSGTARDPWIISAEGGEGGASGWMPGDQKSSYREVTDAGWLLCNGQAVSRSTYASLFAAIGTRFGAGDGVNSFNLPNETGRVAVGSGPGYPQDQTGGTSSTTLTTAMLPAHSHSINHDHASFTTAAGGAHDHTLRVSDAVGGSTNSVPRANNAGLIDSSGAVESGGAHVHAINIPAFVGTSGSVGGGQAFSNLSPYRSMRVLIKT